MPSKTSAADMWDLTITTTHDFYIATATATILVHNCGAAEDGPFLPDEYYTGNAEDLAPGQSSPYSTYERSDENGDLKQVTTYDQFGDRVNQYEVGPGARHGEGSHSFEYSSENPRQAPGGGVPGPHIPF